MQSVLLVAVAGAAGAVSRYGVGILAHRLLGSNFAYGTLLVNVLGCLALGFLLEIERNTAMVPATVRLLFSVGFLGAFTTFSTFGYETVRYLQDGAGNLAMLNISANLLLGCGGIWLGWWAARAFYPIS